jgi:hypothetical protein
MKKRSTFVLNIVLKTCTIILLHKVFDYLAPSLRVAQISKSYRNCFKIQIGQFI